MKINCIIQARMGSERFPGKVLEDFQPDWADEIYTPVSCSIEQCDYAALSGIVVIAIPASEKDDVLYEYLRFYLSDCGDDRYGIVRGPEHAVAARFKKALNEYPCDGFVRICADSPFIMIPLIRAVANRLEAGDPFCYVKGAPKGQQPQACRTDVFREAYPEFTMEEHEHVLIGLQRKYQDYFIDASNMCVDTPEDLERLRAWL